tara:strand:- start:1853 stop:2371 length:519 start_codon:yes stop_codon:yes gene_type:complete
MKNKLVFITIFFILLNFSAEAKTEPPFKNILVLKNPISYKDITFQDYDGNLINLNSFKDNIFILNFWATWCAPCKKEMPSLDELHNVKNIKIFPINVEKHNKYKSQIFFKNLKIKNLSIYFDSNIKLANLFRLTGIPTTIILNKNRNEVARILGPINFSDKKFVNWLNSINE